MSEKSCAIPFAYTPEPITSPFDYRFDDVSNCSNLDGVMNLTNVANVPFDNYGYLQAKTDCTNIYNPNRKTLDFSDSFPVWPLKNSRMYPTQDYTNEAYPLQPEALDINSYIDTTKNWPPPMIPLEPYKPSTPVSELNIYNATVDPNVDRMFVPVEAEIQPSIIVSNDPLPFVPLTVVNKPTSGEFVHNFLQAHAKCQKQKK